MMPFSRAIVELGGLERVYLLITIAKFDVNHDGGISQQEFESARITGEKCVSNAVTGCANFAIISALLFSGAHALAIGRPNIQHPRLCWVDAAGSRWVDAAESAQLPAVGARPGGAHARGCVIGEPERAEQLEKQVRRHQDVHAPRWERRHLGDEGVGLVLELGRALAGVHGER